MKAKTLLFSWNKRIYLFILLFLFVMSSNLSIAQVGINNDNSAPNASAMLDVKATGLGFLAPRMTMANRPVSPATGLTIYQTDVDPGYYYFDGSAWQKIGRAADQFWMANGSDIYYSTGKVGIGIDAPDQHGLYAKNYVSGKAAVIGTDESSGIFATGMLGVLAPSGLGVPINVFNVGVLGIKPNTGFDGAGVYGWTNDTDINNYGGIFAADGSSSNTNYAIYADADSAGTNYAGYFKGRVHVQGNSASDGAADLYSDLVVAEVSHDQSVDTRAVFGISTPVDGYGYGVYGEGGYRGVYGYGNGGGYTGTVVGVYGYSSGTAGTRIGLYGYAAGGSTNWAAYLLGSTYVSADLRIGTTVAATGYALSVNGKIACEELLIDDSNFWPDYVFDEDYPLLPLDEFEASIRENKHLPGMVSAQEVEEKGGFHVGDIQKKTLEKVEELSLYIIELNNRVKSLEQENDLLKTQLAEK
ncbi:MAG: hypothetical protein JW731_08435 [Bacteroidales bacterium]|nr:hypothetical protein [Bacteroidales bacterium]